VILISSGESSGPYRVRIGIIAFGKAEWARLERALAGSAWYSASGEAPGPWPGQSHGAISR
jgi:uncharacterized Zn finger protein